MVWSAKDEGGSEGHPVTGWIEGVTFPHAKAGRLPSGRIARESVWVTDQGGKADDDGNDWDRSLGPLCWCGHQRACRLAPDQLATSWAECSSAPNPYRGAPVTGHQFQQSLRLYPLWEWGLLSALPQGRKTTSGPEHGMRRENAGSSKSACFPEQSWYGES